MDSALWELMEAGNPQDRIAAVIRVNPSIVLPQGIEMVSAFGDVITCRLPRGAISEVWSDEAVGSFKAPRPILPELEIESDFISGMSVLSENDSALLPTDSRRPPHMDETGQTVVMGFIDWGFDFAHPDFCKPDGSSRILALWDQRGLPGHATPSPYGYGVVHTQARLNDALKSADPYQSLGYHPADADPDESGAHATHVASIAAGNGSAGGPVGIAPNADLVFVHMAMLNSVEQKRLGDSVSLLEAVDFIVKLAGDRPCVINLSMGRHGESHDGTTLVEQAFDNLLTEKPGRAIVQSSGNYYNRRIHTSSQIRPGETVSFDWLIHEADKTLNQLEIWYSKKDVLEVEVTSPNSDIRCQVALGKRGNLTNKQSIIGRIYHRKREPNNLDNHITIYLYPDAPPGAWSISLSARDVVDGRFNAWIERDVAIADYQSVFRKTDAVPEYTTGTICNGCRTIAVGAYNPHSTQLEMASFSSAGPTRDGRVKPDLAAPGVYILAARSAGLNEPLGKNALLTRKSGTSMAAPHVAGTLALMFEAAKRPLHIEETHQLLLGTTEWKPEWEAMRNRLGSGYLDIENAVAAARQLGQSATQRLNEVREELMERSREPAYELSATGPQSAHTDGLREARSIWMERSGMENQQTATQAVQLMHYNVETEPEAPIELSIGEEKRYLLKIDPFTEASWSYKATGETDSLFISLESLQLPPGMTSDEGRYQFLSMTALSPGEVTIELSLGQKGMIATEQKILRVRVNAETHTNTPVTAPTATAGESSASDIADWQPWISREEDGEYREREQIESLEKCLAAMEATVYAPTITEQHVPLAVNYPASSSGIESLDFYIGSPNENATLSLPDIADSLIESGFDSENSEALIREALVGANISTELPDPSELFDEYAREGLPALQEKLGGAYDIVGLPGAPLLKPVESGDILIRRALGEGDLIHTAMVDTAELLNKDQLLDSGWTPEGFTSGWYARVLEGGFLPHARTANYARRILDWNGRVAPGQLVLRPHVESVAYTPVWAEAVNRSSKDYIRWIQASLNKVLGLNLAVDGIKGSKTIQAVKTFQRQKGLAADGVVGEKTEQALIAAGASSPQSGGAKTSGGQLAGIPADWQGKCQGTATLLDEFDSDQAGLTTKHQPILQGLAQKIVQSINTAQPVTSVCLIGHTDETGSAEYNIALGQKRADTAMQELMARVEALKPGLTANIAFKTFSLGETAPVSSAKTAQAHALNRRVAIFLTQTAKPKPGICFAPPVSGEDPTTFTVAAAGHQDFNAGSATILGKSFAVFGRVFYPAETSGNGKPFNKKLAAKGKVPIVFLVHGNHGIFTNPAKRTEEVCTNAPGLIPIPNHLGYVYFQEMLAKMGIVSVSVNCNETNCQGGSPTNIRQRAGLILEAIKHFRSKNNGSDPIFGGRIDFSKTGLFGHSRGAEAVLVVPELLGARVDGISDVLIQSVISLAPTDNAASSGIPNGYALMVILPAGDGDVVTNDGAKYYDQAVPSPFKCQLYIHKTNHNFFNREWVNDESHGPAVMERSKHERLLSVYGAAFYRHTLLGQPLRRFLRQDELPPGTPTSDVHISYEERGPLTVDDHENRNIALNSLAQQTRQSAGLTAAEFDFSFTGSATFNKSFFGKTVGMVAQSTSPSGDYTSDLGSPIDLTGKEIWLRVAEVYNGASVPAGGTGFQIGLEDATGNVALLDSNGSLGGLPRPYDRRTDDVAKIGIDLTKTMLKTLRFPSTCFVNGSTGFDITRVSAIHLRLDRNDKRALAFDQVQIV